MRGGFVSREFVRMSQFSLGEKLRRAASQQTLAVPGAFNALSAKMAQQAGFQAIYLSGAAFSAGALAMPDMRLFTLTKLMQHTLTLTRSVEIPLVVDADTGFGEPVNVERTVRELEACGAAAIQMEDQVLPKRCGHLTGKSLVSPSAMCAKLRAAVAARRDPQLVLLARTDARSVEGLDAAIDRSLQYVAAGAVWIFPESLQTRDEFAQFAAKVPVPLVANMTEFGQSELLSVAELQALGYAAVLFPVTLLRLAMKAVSQGLQTLMSEGTQQSLLPQMQTRQELYDLLGYAGFEEADRRYFGSAEELKTPEN